MVENPTRAAIAPGIYIDLEVPGMVFIEPRQILLDQGMEGDNLLEARIYETLRKQYVAIGVSVTLLTDQEAVDDDSSIDKGED